jgi:hypothetical protein
VEETVVEKGEEGWRRRGEDGKIKVGKEGLLIPIKQTRKVEF